MLSRTHTTTTVERSSSMRRLRRRTQTVQRLYCRTNGCASFLVADDATGVAACPICGFTRRLD